MILDRILAFVGKVYAGAGLLLLLFLKLSANHSWLALAAQALVAFVVSLAVFAVDEVYLYPLLRSPLRNLPLVKSGWHARLITERPRGKTPLRWIKEQPEADLFNSRGKLGQSILYPVGPDVLRDIMSTHAYDFEKPVGLRAYLQRVIGQGLITVEGSRHKQQRRSLMPAFNIKHIRALYPTMWHKAGVLLERLQLEMKDAGQVQMVTWASRYALDIIGPAALSRDFDALGMSDYHPIAKAFSYIVEPEQYMVRHLAWMLALPPPLVEAVPSRANTVLADNCAYLRAAAEEILDSKQKQLAAADKGAPPETNLLSKIIGSGELERDEIVDHMLTFIGAGHETSASSIVWAAHLLTLPENLHYQDKLRDEIRSALPAARDGRVNFDASESTLQAAMETLPYLNGICEEVLRLFPTVPATLREAVRKTSAGGTTIPKGTLVVIMMYAINRNPRFWGETAEQLRPERWIDDLPDGSRRANKHGGAVSNYCEVTFLHGAHACIGRDFAKAELKCALAALFGRFELRRLEGDDGKVSVQGSVTTKPKGGLLLKLNSVSGW